MKAFERMMEPLRQRVMLMVAKAIVKMVDDGGGLQRVQIKLLNGELRSDVARVQNYGHSARPSGDTLAVALSIGGNRDHMLVVALDDLAHRPRDLREGEATLYDDLGQRVWLTRDGIVIDGAGKPITIQNAPLLRADVPRFECTGDIVDNCDTVNVSMSGMRSVFNHHDHDEHDGPKTSTPNEEMGS